VFAEKFDDEFSLVATLFSSNIVYELEDSLAWFVDSGSSCHMTRMRSVFLCFRERLRLLYEEWDAYYACREGGWMC
jgi:hypothetical protein